MLLLCDCYAIAMRFLCGCYGFALELLCSCHAVVMLLHWPYYFLLFSSAGRIFPSSKTFLLFILPFSPPLTKYFLPPNISPIFLLLNGPNIFLPCEQVYKEKISLQWSSFLRGLDSAFPPALKFLDDPSESAARQKKPDLKKSKTNWNQKRKRNSLCRKIEMSTKKKPGGEGQSHVPFSPCIVPNFLKMPSWSIFT